MKNSRPSLFLSGAKMTLWRYETVIRRKKGNSSAKYSQNTNSQVRNESKLMQFIIHHTLYRYINNWKWSRPTCTCNLDCVTCHFHCDSIPLLLCAQFDLTIQTMRESKFWMTQSFYSFPWGLTHRGFTVHECICNEVYLQM